MRLVFPDGTFLVICWPLFRAFKNISTKYPSRVRLQNLILGLYKLQEASMMGVCGIGKE
jgi:hypothetical protein